MGTRLLSACEASADRLGAAVLGELGTRQHELTWHGIGGPELRQIKGFKPFARAEELSGAGLVELVPQLPALLAARRQLRAAVQAQPDLAFLIDAPDLHLPLAKLARKARVPVVMLGVPQFWAWRPERVRTVCRDVRLALCLFRFEVAPIRARGAAAHWVGHPLADEIPQPVEPPSTTSHLRVAFLPGSRPSQVGRALRLALPELRAALPPSAIIEVPWRLDKPPPKSDAVTFSRESAQTILRRVDMAVVAFGTATLEAAMLGVPAVSFGAPHPLTRRLAQPLLQTSHLALPNILLEREAVPEVLVDSSQTMELRAAVSRLLRSLPAGWTDARALSLEIREKLGGPGFARRVCDALEPLL